MRDYRQLDAILDRLLTDIYPEHPTATHRDITGAVFDGLCKSGTLRPGQFVLDVGCGQGVALGHFRDAGMPAIGITLGDDVDTCLKQGFQVLEMDQSFLVFKDGIFDVVWARHVLEHSPIPLLSLAEYHRVLKADGIVYVEVPAPDQICVHENNPNHYSVFGSKMWVALFNKAGFNVKSACSIDHDVPLGKDCYLGFILIKASVVERQTHLVQNQTPDKGIGVQVPAEAPKRGMKVEVPADEPPYTSIILTPKEPLVTGEWRSGDADALKTQSTPGSTPGSLTNNAPLA